MGNNKSKKIHSSHLTLGWINIAVVFQLLKHTKHTRAMNKKDFQQIVPK
jgi:archaellum component FlaD/FlaE